MQRYFDFSTGVSEQMLRSKMDRVNRLRGTPNQILVGQEPAHIRNDVWAGKKISKDELMIASIRTHVESIGTEGQSQRILINIARHVELTIMQAGKENQEQ